MPVSGELAVVAPVKVHVNVVTVQLSLNVASFVAITSLHNPNAADVVISTGQFTTGNSISVTVTNCVHVLVLPFTSVTVQVTVVTPTG